MTRKTAVVVIAIASLAAGLLAVAPLGITGGSPDTVHTNVGLVRFTADGSRFAVRAP